MTEEQHAQGAGRSAHVAQAPDDPRFLCHPVCGGHASALAAAQVDVRTRLTATFRSNSVSAASRSSGSEADTAVARSAMLCNMCVTAAKLS